MIFANWTQTLNTLERLHKSPLRFCTRNELAPEGLHFLTPRFEGVEEKLKELGFSQGFGGIWWLDNVSVGIDSPVGLYTEGRLLCHKCNDSTSAIVVFHSNIFPYQATCSKCGKVLVEPASEK